jgi:acetoin utilization deacetylase AcuC-like enzyme
VAAGGQLEIRSHPDCLRHEPGPGHPDAPERLAAVLAVLDRAPIGWSLDRHAPLPSEDTVTGALRWIHDAGYLERLRATIDAGPGWIDSHDCRVSSGTWAAVLAAAGLALQAALDIANGRLWRAFLAVRPPSANAGPSRASGFCLVNSAALAAEVLARCWQQPVLVADFDVVHCGGTQEIFWRRGDVGVVSVHRYPFFPGTGGGDEVGEDEGVGATRNVPLAAGADDGIYATAFERALDEVAGRLRPSAVVLSAGFGAHREDPLGGMAVTEAGFARMTAAAVRVADRYARGRVLSLLEGGYLARTLPGAVRRHVEVLADVAPSAPDGGETVH